MKKLLGLATLIVAINVNIQAGEEKAGFYNKDVKFLSENINKHKKNIAGTKNQKTKKTEAFKVDLRKDPRSRTKIPVRTMKLSDVKKYKKNN